jgi:hypothetical protein
MRLMNHARRHGHANRDPLKLHISDGTTRGAGLSRHPATMQPLALACTAWRVLKGRVAPSVAQNAHGAVELARAAASLAQVLLVDDKTAA